jgi:hypothetical protein
MWVVFRVMKTSLEFDRVWGDELMLLCPGLLGEVLPGGRWRLDVVVE